MVLLGNKVIIITWSILQSFVEMHENYDIEFSVPRMRKKSLQLKNLYSLAFNNCFFGSSIIVSILHDSLM